MNHWRRIGLFIVFAWFFGGGIGHFVVADFFARIVPPYVPMDPYMAVYVSGVFEILGAIGILIPATRQYAGWGLILLTLVVSSANIHMWQHPDLFPEIPPWALSLRLVIQVGLLWCIWASTRPTKR